MYQTEDYIQYVFKTGGELRQSQFHIQISKDDFEFLIGRMLEVAPSSTCDAFNKALKKQLRKSKTK